MNAYPNLTTAADELADRILAQRKLANRCTCGKPGDVYAADECTPLCGRWWWAIYGEGTK